MAQRNAASDAAQQRVEENLRQGGATEESCRNKVGVRINSQECIAFFKAQNRPSDIECFQSPSCRSEAEARNAKARARAEEEERQRAHADARAEEAVRRRAAASKSAMQSKCGDDYKAPRIGMNIDRVRECVTSVRLTSQINRADGIVSTYEGGGAYFHVMDGRVVAWGR
ncbi:MAG: hypothetical protein ACLGJD_05525 [Gammaproteobacteria bacterium]